MQREVIGPNGEATLYCGDCLEILPTLDKVDAVVTDPPYGIGFAAQPTKWQRRAGHKAQSWDDKIFDAINSVLEIGDYRIIWGGNYYALPLSRGWFAWTKPDAPPSMGSVEFAWSDIDRTARHISYSISATNAERVGHPTQKPLAVMEWCLGFIPDAETILDPFMGSGTTGVACANIGRRFIGIEIEPKYYDIARKRIEDAYSQAQLFAPDEIAQPVQGALL